MILKYTLEFGQSFRVKPTLANRAGEFILVVKLSQHRTLAGLLVHRSISWRWLQLDTALN